MVNYWVVRVGSTKQQQQYAIGETIIDRAVVGIGWPEVGNIEQVNAQQDVVKRVLDTYEGYTAGRARNEGGSLYYFAHSIAKGDVVLTPMNSAGTKEILMGKVTGRYLHNPQAREEGRYLLSNTREVNWIRTDVPWDRLSDGLRASLGAERTVYSVNKHADEIDRLWGTTATRQTNADGNGSKGTRSARSVTPETIARNESLSELDPDEQQFYAMRRGVLKQRNARHQELVRDFARALPPCKALMEDPFDYATLTSRGGVLLAEMKTLDGTPGDERRQVRAAVGQLLYYEGLCLPDELTGKPLVKAAVFDKPPSPEHARWMEGLEIAVVWQEGDAFAASPESNELIEGVGLSSFIVVVIA